MCHRIYLFYDSYFLPVFIAASATMVAPPVPTHNNIVLFHVDSFLLLSINSYYHQIYYTHYIENNQYRKYIVFVISESWRKGKLS